MGMHAKYKTICLISSILVYSLVTPASFAANPLQQSTLIADWNGACNEFEQQGVTLTGDYVSETVSVLKDGEASGIRYAQP